MWGSLGSGFGCGQGSILWLSYAYSTVGVIYKEEANGDTGYLYTSSLSPTMRGCLN